MSRGVVGVNATGESPIQPSSRIAGLSIPDPENIPNVCLKIRVFLHQTIDVIGNDLAYKFEGISPYAPLSTLLVLFATPPPLNQFGRQQLS